MVRIWIRTVCCLICISSFYSWTASANEAILMDTRTATSDVGWTMSQGSKWQEISSPHPDKSDRRMLVVCQIKQAHQDNWARTPFIPIDGAMRVFVEFEFTIRSCEDVPNVATCKETFNLYYYETDRDEASTTFPPWREGAYIKVDTIAADKRFGPGSEETNFETREIGPLTKKGIYLALQDTGACMALMHVRVYYKYCSPSTQILANFERTVAGPEMTSLVEVGGSCVANSMMGAGQSPSLFCNGKGEWTVPKGSCVCDAGFSPNPSLTSCQACGRGQYKNNAGNADCQRCPAYSHSRDYASTVCECMYGYYRAPTDLATSPCTKTPSRPEDLRVSVNQTNAHLTWNRPLHDGGRNDLTYRVECFRCQFGYRACTSCDDDVDYTPSKSGLTSPSVTVQDLSSFAYYKFKVFALNGVTSVASRGQQSTSYAEITAETSQAAPSVAANVAVTHVTDDAFLVTWAAPSKLNGRIREYEVTVTSLGEQKGPGEVPDQVVSHTSKLKLQVTGLDLDSEYLVTVRAQTSAGYGPYSTPLKVRTRLAVTSTTEEEKAKPTTSMLHLVLAVIAGSLLVVIVIAVVFFCKRRSKGHRSTKMMGDFEKFAMMQTGGVGARVGGSMRSYPPSIHKTYIDPTTYEDPQRAVLDFTKEIDSSYVAIEEVIGGGEFGEVCRGRTRLPSGKEEQQVAIKTLKSGYSTQQKLDFLGEASIMGQFDHPNVIRLEGVVTKSRPHMIITEYMENGSLDAFLRKHDGEFTVIQLVGILRNIAAGMKYLSDMGYVHRDLAARNILVNAQLICKVSDFGLSRVLEEDSDATYTTRGGKIPIRWTAPEAITYRKFTSASDVWSYGIVMWEVMSYGERPYWGMSNQDVIQAVGTGYRLPAPMDCPQVQHQLMVECWKKNRNDRPKFGQIVTALDRMLRDPSQLKAIAGPDPNCNGHLLHENPGNFSCNDPDAATLLLDKRGGNKESIISEITRSHVDLSSLGSWLDSLELESYKENFVQNGCTSLEQVLQLTPNDLSLLGIGDIDHQDRLMDSIGNMRSHNYQIRDTFHQKDDRVTWIPV